MSVVVTNKRPLDTPEDVRKRIKCSSSPFLVDSLQKQTFQERLGRLQRMFPDADSSVLQSALESCNHAPDPFQAAIESLQHLQVEVEEERGVKRSLTQTFESSASTEPPSQLDEFADRLVRSLHGCPSMDEAKNRAKAALHAFRQQKQAEIDQTLQQNAALQHSNRVLMRTMQIMNEKHRGLKQSADASEQLRSELIATQEQLRKSEQNVKVLQWHIAQHRDGSAGGPSCGPPGVF